MGEFNPRIPCITITFCFPVLVLASFTAPSTASEPEFQKKKLSSDGWGMMGRSFSMSSRYLWWKATLTCIIVRLLVIRYEVIAKITIRVYSEAHLGVHNVEALVCSCLTDFRVRMT